MTTRLSAVRAAVDELRRPESFARHVAATSSNEAAIAVTRTGTPAIGSMALTVERLATAHQVAVGGAFAAADALVGAGQLTLSRPDGTAIGALPTDDTTILAALAGKVNDLKTGVTAQVVKTGEGAYRLVLTAGQTGDASRFAVAADLDGLGASEILREGVDAHLRLGTLDLFRASNTVNDLVDGVSLQLRQAGGGPVTITTERDVDAAVTRVRGLVDSLNAALSTLARLSSYSAESNEAGAAAGQRSRAEAGHRPANGDLGRRRRPRRRPQPRQRVKPPAHAPVSGSFAAVVRDGDRSRAWLERNGERRWLHLDVGGDDWRGLLLDEPLAVSWVGSRSVGRHPVSADLGLVLGYGIDEDAGASVRRPSPVDLALAIRAQLPRA